MSPEAAALVDAAAAPYRAAGRFAWHFARGKLRHDPAYLAFLRRGAFAADGARILDLGCGQGVLFALLDAARRAHAAAAWPDAWPTPAGRFALRGIDLRGEAIRRARTAFGDAAAFEHGDVCDAALGEADVVVMMDVLHYLEPARQDALLDAIATALPRGGRFVTRIGDAGAGARYVLTRAGDWLVSAVRGTPWPRFHCRPAAEWSALLDRHGFEVNAEPMSAGTPFANVMLNATRR
jgi:SAM-dependent methyltransferase